MMQLLRLLQWRVEEVSQVNAGSQEPVGYENLYRAHFPRVVRLCGLLLAGPHEAEDVAQEVFVKLL
jgi:DNA-directed RNA polymerase specialized sigma24 family protein